jgi:hypothetical protein
MTNEEPDENGEARWRVADTGKLERGSILVLDEISMISVDEARIIEKMAKRNEVQVIMCGDMAQLSPVKGLSIAEALERIPVRFRLSEVMRSGSKGIVAVSKSVRTTGDIDLDAIDNETVFVYNDSSAFDKAFVETEGAVAIAYTNRRVDQLNQMKRTKIYGANPKKFENGEGVVLIEAPFFIDVKSGGSWQKVRVAENNDELTVLYSLGEAKDTNPFSKHTITSTRLMLENKQTKVQFEARALTYSDYVDTFKAIFDDILAGVRAFAGRLDALTRKGVKDISLSEVKAHFKPHEAAWIAANSGRGHKWIDTTPEGYTPAKGAWSAVKALLFARDLYGFKARFAVLVYEHAFTAHRSQGSGFPHVFVDLPNLLTIRDADDRQAACYVAVSRAADTLHIRI